MKKFFLTVSFLVLSLLVRAMAQGALAPGQAPVTNTAATPQAAPVPPSTPTVQTPEASTTEQAAPGATTQAQTQAPAPTNPELNDPLLEGFFEDLQYSPADKRDPYLPYFVTLKQKLAQNIPSAPLEPLQAYALSELKIVGIIWDVGRPKALVLDPSGKSHIVVENTKLGKDYGYVAAIREGEIIVVEPIQDAEGKKGYQTKVLKLSKQ